MQDFSLFFPLGWEHIISWDALDHILFITALTVIFNVHQWRQLLILVSAFTMGHFITLWLTVAGHVTFPAQWVEFLIPVTIVCTAGFNIFQTNERLSINIHYMLASGFGLIHGMGYANAIRFSLTSGQSMGWSLFGFNVGLELGQMLVVAGVLSISAITLKIGLKRHWWIRLVSVAILWISIQMAWERVPFSTN